MRLCYVLLVALLVVSAGCSSALGIETETEAGPEAPAASEPGGSTGGGDGAAVFSDPETDRLGWEGGRWYNESLDVDRSDGLNRTELDAVVNRSMARVEQVRRLEFERTVPVEVISREEFADRRSGRYENVSAAGRLHHNVKLEALFFVPEDESALATQESSSVGGTGGFYVPAQDRITVISDNATSPKLDEITLAQELFHALQDRRFGEFNDRINESYNDGTLTTERHNTFDAVTEGDGTYVDYLYEQRCGAEWDCLLPPESDGDGGGGSGSGSGSDVHLGLNVMGFQPYSDGPPFVRSVQRRGGWGAVDELYEEPPASTEQVIHPEEYGADPPTDVTVTDRSAAEWEIIPRPPDSVGIGYVQTSARNATFGEAGLFAMFVYPSYRSEGETQIVPVRQFLNRAPDGDGLDPVDPLDYNSSYSTGWDGDTLVMYADDRSAATNETGYVWKTVWDSPADAREFRDGYERLLDYHGAEQVGPDTYRLPPESGFGDAIHVTVEGDVVRIVNAPTVDDLDAIDGRVDVERGSGDRT